MIQWRNVEADARPRNLADTLSTLPFADMVALTAILMAHPVILVSPKARRLIVDHVSKGREERGGLLLGFAAMPDEEFGSAVPNPLICIADAVASELYVGTSVSLHMDPSVWTAAMSQRDDGQLVVGWFHSHPNHGAFFSGTDRKTQRNFFSHEYSVGYVIDPIRDDHAFFVGPESIEIDRAHVLDVSAESVSIFQC